MPAAPVPSLLRGFSAPVKWHYTYSKADLLCIALNDEDGFNRWDAIQQYAVQLILDIKNAQSASETPVLDEAFIAACGQLLNDEDLDPAMVALMLDLPSEAYLAEQQYPMDIDGNHHAREFLRLQLATQLLPQWQTTFQRLNDNTPFSPSAAAVARRSLKNLALNYCSLVDNSEYTDLVVTQFNTATNMTDSLAALKTAINSSFASLQSQASTLLEQFYSRWQNESLVVNLWLSVQASAAAGALNRVKTLMAHEAYDGKNPNKIRALVGVFSQNLTQFHECTGIGYEFLAQQVVLLDSQNPQIAARLVGPLTKWQRQDAQRQNLMIAQLRWIASHTLSNDLFEVVTKSLPV